MTYALALIVSMTLSLHPISLSTFNIIRMTDNRGDTLPEVVKAYVLATVKRGTEHKVASKIRKMEEVTEALVTYGLYDLVIRIEAKSLSHLDKIITDMRQIEEIEQTSTLVGS